MSMAGKGDRGKDAFAITFSSLAHTGQINFVLLVLLLFRQRERRKMDERDE